VASGEIVEAGVFGNASSGLGNLSGDVEINVFFEYFV